MALLGFNAIGSLAVAQIGRSSAYNLVALAGHYVVTGSSSTFSVLQSTSGTSIALLGADGHFSSRLMVSAATYSATGSAAIVLIRQATGTAGYAVSGRVSSFLVVVPAGATACSFVGNATSFKASLSSLPGHFVLTGYPSGYARDFEAWFPRPFDGADWNVNIVENQSWSPNPTQLAIWRTRAENTGTWTPAIKQPENWTNE